MEVLVSYWLRLIRLPMKCLETMANGNHTQTVIPHGTYTHFSQLKAGAIFYYKIVSACTEEGV